MLKFKSMRNNYAKLTLYEIFLFFIGLLGIFNVFSLGLGIFKPVYTMLASLFFVLLTIIVLIHVKQ